MVPKIKGIPKQPKPANRIRITNPDANAEHRGKIDIQKGLRTTVPHSPKYSTTSPVATTFDAWTATNDKADKIYESIITASSNLEQLYTSLGTMMGQYAIDRDAFLVAARAVCNNEDDAKSFGLSTPTHRRQFDAVPPSALHFAVGGVPGDLAVRWPAVRRAGAYVAEQCAGNAPTDAGWVQCYMGRPPSFKLTQLTLGETLWFRVRSVGKTLSAWSDPAFVVVR
jgi:hypothetical protein